LNRITRRRFGKLLLAGTGLGLLAGCSAGPIPGGDGAPGSGLGGLLPTPAPSRPILKNLNLPGFHVRYFKPFQAVDPGSWVLSVEGLVDAPVQLDLSEMRSLDPVTQASRMTCVEGWSAAARWGGFRLATLEELVKPLPEARWVHFVCADTYYESLPIDDVRGERVLFAHSMNGEHLPNEYGFPLRLIVPDRYGYKGAKAIANVVFAADERIGLWSRMGPYSTAGRIQPGWDLALDLQETRRIEGGETRYPDGLESQG
jgi:DMSO/TMAO reductase YedYZ molybdopterin-dependent catalytic subunit